MESKELLTKIAKNLEQIAGDRDKFKQISVTQKEEIIKLKAEIDELKSSLASSADSSNVQNKTDNSSSNEDLKKRIDGLVEEIDECLTLLND